MRPVLLLVIASACTIETGEAQPELVVTRDDGSRIQMPPNTETFAFCDTYDEPYHLEPAIKVFHRSPIGGSSWYAWAVRADVSQGQTITFPVTFTTSEPARGALFFVADDETDNEAASSQDDSTGTISYVAVDCAGFVEFTIDATLGSEYGDGTPIRVTGSFRAPVGARPD